MGTLKFIGAEVLGVILAVYTVAFLWGMSYLLDALNAPDSLMAFAGYVGLLVGAAFNGLLLWLFVGAAKRKAMKVIDGGNAEEKDEKPDLPG